MKVAESVIPLWISREYPNNRVLWSGNPSFVEVSKILKLTSHVKIEVAETQESAQTLYEVEIKGEPSVDIFSFDGKLQVIASSILVHIFSLLLLYFLKMLQH